MYSQLMPIDDALTESYGGYLHLEGVQNNFAAGWYYTATLKLT